MINVQQFKNKIERFQENVDYAYDENKKTYTIYHEELKNTFWGDSSKEVEYKATEDERGNIQFRKSVIFRSSREAKGEIGQPPFIHSIEKMRDKEWQKKNLGSFPKVISVSPSNLKNSKSNFRESTDLEEFGYYREWRPSEEPVNTIHYRKKEGDSYFEEKLEWEDKNSQVVIQKVIESEENFFDGSKKKEPEVKENKDQVVVCSKLNNKEGGSDNNFLTGLVISGAVLVLVAGLVVTVYFGKRNI